MARRTKYTPETVAKIVQALDLGATYELACGYAGIHPATFYGWLKTKSEFFDAIKQSEGRAAVKWLAKIEQAASEQWQAAAWKLERRYPASYGKTIQEKQYSGSVTVTHRDLSAFTDPEVDALAAIAERHNAGELVS